MSVSADRTALYRDLAIPYCAVFYSIENDDGVWLRRGEYPELPDCSAESDSVLETMDALERERVRVILAFHRRGESPPRPRPPLASGVSEPSLHLLEELLAADLDAGESGIPEPL